MVGFLLWGLWGGAPGGYAKSISKKTAPSQTQAPPEATFHYQMTGRIRLLFFWLSRDNIGSGTITHTQLALQTNQKWMDSVEVLFGSDPKRVPGGINRWGYAKEIAFWSQSANPSGDLTLDQTLFEGFMRHSDEETISQVTSGQAREQSKQQYWYDGCASLHPSYYDEAREDVSQKMEGKEH
jgi:hypothetical protein